jgi:hypothetical protein
MYQVKREPTQPTLAADADRVGTIVAAMNASINDFVRMTPAFMKWRKYWRGG